MAVTAEPTKGSLRISYSYGSDSIEYAITKLNAAANADRLIQLAFAASELKGLEPMDVLFDCEFHLRYV